MTAMTERGTTERGSSERGGSVRGAARDVAFSPPKAAASAAPAAPTKIKLPRDQDPRNPILRLRTLLDAGSAELITADDDSGMLAATGTVNGCPVVAFCSDPTVMGGAMGVDGCDVVVRAYERAMHDQVPILGIWHSGGARLAEGVLSLDGVGRIFHAMTQASGKIPQISIVLGFAAGGAAYGPALTDVVILAPEGRIFVTGPDVVRSVTGEDVDMLRLGGPDTHGRRSGVVHVVAEDEGHAIEQGRALATLLADQGQTALTVRDVDLAALLPESPRRADRRRAREQPAAPRWLSGRAECGEGGPVRPHVRHVRGAAGRRRRCARLPAGRRARMGWGGTPRREAAACVRRGGGAARHAGDS
jgi:acetyl-CoA carboxylase carboxyltransferase component